jgi:hypothetical protein
MLYVATLLAASLQWHVARSDPIDLSSSSIQFDLKLTNVDSSSAEFEILDDNRTTLNYQVSYTLTSNNSISSNGKVTSIMSTNSFAMQTNSQTMLAEQEKLLSDDEPNLTIPPDDSGEFYEPGDKAKIRSKPYEEVHRFLVPDLEPNR